MKTTIGKNVENSVMDNKKKGISLVALVITIVVSLMLITVIILSIKESNPSDSASEAVFRNDFVVLQNELTSSKLNMKINNFEAKEDIDVSMNDPKINEWLPSLKESPLQGKVEICNGEVVFIIPEEESDEYKWAEKLAGAEKVCKSPCADSPNVFSPQIEANVKSGEMSTSAVTLQISGGTSQEVEYYYEYSLDKGESFSKIQDGDGKSLTFDDVYLRQIVQIRTVATIDGEEVRSTVSEFEVYINKTGTVAPTITALNGYVSGEWTSETVEITITTENPTEQETIEYTLDDGATWLQYSKSTAIKFVDDGSYHIRARVVTDDEVIGPESTTFIVNINKKLTVAPTIKIVGSDAGSGSWNSQVPVQIEILSEDSELVSYYEYSLDGGTTWTKWSTGDSNIQISTEGATNIIARSYNQLGKVGATSDAFVINVDTVKPVALISTSATTNSILANVQTSDIGGSGADTYLFYKDGKLVASVKDNEYTFTNLEQSKSYTIGCMVIDTAGNKSELVEELVKVGTIDKPIITLDNENYTNSNKTATISKANLAGTSIEYQIVAKDGEIDEDEWQPYSLPIPISKNCDIYARVIDATNQKSENASLPVRKIDKQDPNKAAPSATSTTSTVTVTANQADEDETIAYANSGINSERTQYSIKKGDLWSEYQYNNTFSNLDHDTDYLVKTRVYDNAGNFSDSEETVIRTQKLEVGKIYLTLDDADGDNYVAGTAVNKNVYVSIDEQYKNNTTYTSKVGSVQSISKTNEDTLVETEGVTTIVVETTDNFNTVSQEYIILIDKTGPSVTAIEVIDPETGKYASGTKVTFNVTWTENLNVVTAPVLNIKFGESDVKQAEFISNSGNQMIYEYTIETNDNGVLAVYDYMEGEVYDTVNNEAVVEKQIISGNEITAANEFSVTVVSTPMNAGTVTGNTKATYLDNITISATPNAGYVFKKWTTSSDNVVLNNENSPTTSFRMPAEDVTVTANFGVIEYTIKYDANGGIGDSFESIHQYDKEAKLTKNTYTKQGYTFVGWSTDKNAITPEYTDEQEVTNLSAIDSDVITLYAIWQIGVSEYKVEHYIENIDSSAYILEQVENLTATTESIATANSKEYTGFYFDESSSDNVISGTVVGDGSLTLKLYYNRNTYTLTVDPNGGTFANTTDTSSINGKYEETITLQTPIKQGYEFNGWTIDEGNGDISSNKFTYDASDAKITAQWIAGTSSYKVEHYKENIDSTGYDLVETETLDTITDNTVTATLKDYSGFSNNKTIEGTLLEGKVLADNSLVLKAYYVRNTYNLTIDPNGGTYKDVSANVVIPGKYETTEKVDSPTAPTGYKVTYNANGGTAEKEEDYTINSFSYWTKSGYGEFNSTTNEFKYLSGDGTLKANYVNDGLTLPNATREGYDFTGWYKNSTHVGDAGKNYKPTSAVNLVAGWTPKTDTLYKVEHYKENIDKNGYELFETDELQGITDSQVLAINKTYEGFTYDESIEGTVAKGNINADGSLTLKLYYTRNVHTLIFAITPVNSGTVLEAKDYAYGQTVNIEAQPSQGYLFTKWTVTTSNTSVLDELSASTSFVMPDSDVSITAAFKGISYTVKYDANLGIGTMSNVAHTYDEVKALSKNTFTRSGYTFIGWNTDKDATSTMYLDEEEVINLTTTNGDIVTLYAIWSAGTLPYKSEHYVENLDGTYSLYKTDNLTGTTDSTVYADPKEIEGFSYDSTNQDAIYSGIVTDEETLTLKTYYTRNTYKLTIDPNSGYYNSSSEDTILTGKYEETITLQTPEKEGYTFNGWTTESIGVVSDTSYTFAASDEKITATYKANEYTLTYNYNNATSNNTLTSQNVTYDKPYGTLPSPTKEFTVSYNLNNGTATLTENNTDSKYSFAGWYLTSTFDSTTIISETTNVSKASNHNAYAKWVGGSITLPEATKVGYTLEGWYLESSLNNKIGKSNEEYTPSANVTLYAKWTPNTNTEYKVLHYKQNVTETGYDLEDTENLIGTTGATVTATPKSYDGFAYDSNNANNFITSTIAANGSLELKVYYVRNTYNLTVDPNGGKFRESNGVTTIAKKYEQSEIIEDPTVPSAITVSYETNGGTSTLVEQNTTSAYMFTNWSHTGVGTFNTDTKTYTFGLGNGQFVANYVRNDVVLPSSEKEGYIFDGWYLDEALQNKIGDAGIEYTPENSTTLYAGWIAKTDIKYEIQHYFENADATGFDLHETQVEYGTTGTTVSATANTYEGFTFDDTIDGTLTSSTVLADGSLQLKLYYIRNLYSLTINPNGGTWNNTTASTVLNNKHGKVITISDPTPPQDIILEYELNGGTATITEENTNAKFTFIDWENKAVGSYNSSTNEFTYGIGSSHLVANYNTDSVTLPEVVKEGYTFAGWYSDENFNTSIGNALSEYIPSTDTKAYAKWISNKDTIYKVEHYKEDIDTATYTLAETETLSGETETEVSAVSKSYAGFKYDSTIEGTISVGTIKPDGSLILKLYYSRNAYDLTINPNGGTWNNTTENTVITNKHGKVISIADPEVPASINVTYVLNNGTASITSDNTTSVYEFTSWTNSGVGSFNSSEKIFTYSVGAGVLKANYSNKSITLPTPTRLGYTFNGWYNDSTFTTKIGNAGAQYTPDKDISLYAKWTANKVPYTVEHYTEDLYGNTYTLAQTESLTGYTDSTVTASAKSFTGFTYNDSYVENVKSGIVSADKSNPLVLKLYYTRNSYTVSLTMTPATAGSVTGAGSYKYGETVSVSANLNNGYSFNSWSTTTTGVSIADSSAEDTTFVMPASDVNVTAKFNVNGYKITYILNGGTETTQNPTSYTVLTNDITLNNPTREGYAFKGWTTPDNLVPTKEVTIEKGSIGDRTYTANWQYATVNAVDIGSPSSTFDSVNGTIATSSYGGYVIIYVPDKDYIFTVTNSSKNAGVSISDTIDGTYESVVALSSEGVTTSSYTTTKECYVKVTGSANTTGTVTLLTGEAAYIEDEIPRYTVTYYLNDGTETVYETGTYRKYTFVNMPSVKPTRSGYVFKGWNADKNATAGTVSGSIGYISSNPSYYAIWAKSTTYRVEYYRQNIAVDGYDLYESEVIDATTGDEVTATIKDYTSDGFTYDSDVTGTITSGTVVSDGSLTLKLYYSRNYYKLTVNPNGGTWNGVTGQRILSRPHGRVIDIEVPTRDGYEFAGWTKSGAGSITTSTPVTSATQSFTYGLGDATLTAKWTAIQSSYKVEHYKQNIDYTYTLEQTENLYATTGTTVSATAKSYTGFTYSSSIQGTVTSGTVEGDGSLTLKLYYSRNEYNLTINPNGGQYDGDSTTRQITGLYESTYTMDKEVVPPVGYTVTYNANGGVATKSTDTSTKSFSGWTKSGIGNYDSTTEIFTFGSGNGTLKANYINNEITLTDATRQGYYLEGWYSDEELTTKVGTSGDAYTPDQDITLYANWEASDGIEYNVYHYLENVDGTYPTTPNYTQTLKGKTGETVTAKENTYTGYSVDTSVSGTVANGTVLADGSLILKLYYPRNSYTLTLTAGTGGTVATSGEYRYGETVTIEATPSSGYSFNSWSTTNTNITITSTSSATTTFVMPAGNVNITGNFKTNVYKLTVNPGGTVYTQNYNTTKSVSSPTVNYTVSFDSNGGTSFSDSTSKRGFVSWTLEGAGKISNEKDDPTTYTFGAGAGTLTANYNETGATIVLPTPTKTGYTFKGWYDAETSNNGSGNLIGVAGANYEPSSDVTLYAKWQVNSYKLTVNPGGTVYTQNYSTTKSVTAPEEYYTVSFDVNGGNSESSINSNRDFINWEFEGAGSISSSTDNPTTYTYGAGAGILTANYNSTGEEITLPLPTRAGYRFDGWYDTETSDNGSGNLIGIENDSYIPTSDVKLYAKWTVIDYTLTVEPEGTTYTGNYNNTQTITLSPKYTIKFNTNGATTISDMTSNRTVTKWTLSGKGSLSSTTSNPTIFTFGEGDATVTATYSTTGEAITLPSISREGYTFDGWYLDSGFTTKAGTTGSANSSYTPSGSSDTITLYAKWTLITYTISYELDGGTESTANPVSYNVESETFTLNNPTKTGYTFTGWTGSNSDTPETTVTIDTGSIGNRTYTANWSINSYQLKYLSMINRNEKFEDDAFAWTLLSYGNVDTNLTYNGLSTMRITSNNTGYDGIRQGSIPFKNNTTYYLTTTVYRDSTSSYGDLNRFLRVYLPTANASGTVIKYNVTHSVSKSSLPDKTWQTHGKSFTTGADGTKFSAFYLDYEKGETVPTNMWIAAARVEEQVQSSTVQYGDKIGELPETPTRTGYTFEGWYTKRDGNGTKITSADTIMGASDMTLYANWVRTKYTITYNANGGTVDTSSYTAEYGKPVTLPTPTRAGYTFDGWYTLASGGSKWTVKYMPAYNQTLYAQWTPIDYTISYTLNEGTLSTANPETYNASTETFTLINPTREGYTFTGWTGSNSDTPETTVTIEKGSIGNRTYTANWSINSYKLSFLTTISRNEKFENDAEEWYLYSYGAVDTDVTYDGQPTMRITSSDTGYDGITQFDIPFKNSTTYVISAMAYRDSTSSYGDLTRFLRVYVPTLDSTDTVTDWNIFSIYYNNLPDKTWKEFATSFTTSADGSRFRGFYLNFEAMEGTSNIWIANARIEEQIQSSTIQYGDEMGEFPTPTRDGYTFGGWYTQRDGKGTKVTSTTTMPGQNTALYAYWIKNTEAEYTVNHYLMDNYGNYSTLRPSFKETFTGEVGDTLILENLVQTEFPYQLENATYYSHGAVNDETVSTTTIAADGSTVINLYYGRTYGTLTTIAGDNISSVTEQNEVKYYYAATIPELTATLATEEGYDITFDGWTSNLSYMENITTNPTTEFSWPAMPEGTAITLTANATKTPKQYTLTRTATTGGTISGSSGTITYGTSCTVTATPSSGYIFAGWYDGDTKVSSDASYTFTMPAKDYTLKAKFQLDSVTISWMESPNFTYNSNAGTITNSGNAIWIYVSSEGYTFNLNSTTGGSLYIAETLNGTKTQVALASSSSGSTTDSYTTTEAGYIYFNSAGGKIEILLENGDTAKIIDGRPEYTLTYYSPTIDTIYATQTVKQWDRFDHANITTPTRDGYEFDAWGTTEGAYYNDSPYVRSDLEFLSLWTKTVYTLTRTGTTGGTVTGSNGSINIGTSCTVTATPSSGYAFVGWYEGETLVSSEASYTFTMPEKDYTITAKFQIDTIAVENVAGPYWSYNTDEGTVTIGSNSVWMKIPSSGYTITVTEALQGNIIKAPEINGSPQTQIMASSEVGTTYVTTEECYIGLVGGAGTIQFTLENGQIAKVIDNTPTYTINYYSPTAETLYHTKTIKQKQLLSHDDVEVPTREGYTFDSWGTMDGSEYTGSYYIDSNVDFLALWTANNYTLIRTATTGGTVTGDSGTITYGTSCTVTATPLTGYVFMGWYDSGTTLMSTDLSYTFTMPANKLTLVAKFQKTSVDLLKATSYQYNITAENGYISKGTGELYFYIPSADYILNIVNASIATSSTLDGTYTYVSLTYASDRSTTYTTTGPCYLKISNGGTIYFKLYDGSVCTINNGVAPVEIVQYMSNYTTFPSFATLTNGSGTPGDTYFTTTGGVATILYVPQPDYIFESDASGVSVYYSNTINGTYTTVGAVATSSTSSQTYTSTAGGYYKFLGNDIEIHVTGPNDSWVSISNKLPKVTIGATIQGTASYEGNKITTGSGGSIKFKPSVSGTLSITATSGGAVSKSTTEDGSYTTDQNLTSGGTFTYTFEPDYWYQLAGMSTTGYITDENGSAVQFVTE